MRARWWWWWWWWWWWLWWWWWRWCFCTHLHEFVLRVSNMTWLGMAEQHLIQTHSWPRSQPTSNDGNSLILPVRCFAHCESIFYDFNPGNVLWRNCSHRFSWLKYSQSTPKLNFRVSMSRYTFCTPHVVIRACGKASPWEPPGGIRQPEWKDEALLAWHPVAYPGS